MNAVDARNGLRSMLELLARIRASMMGKPSASPADLESLAREAAALKEILGRSGIMEQDGGVGDGELAELANLAAAVKIEMGVVGRLAAGGARYAALIKSLGEAAPAGLYGPDGARKQSADGGIGRRA